MSFFRASSVTKGHAGHETADFAVERIPAAIQDALSKLLATDKPYYDPAVVGQMLIDTISSIDDGIAQALYDIFPETSTLEGLSDDAIRTIINDADRGGKNSTAVLRCMRGTTVLLSLFDVQGGHLWVASLGDCLAGTWIYTFP